jgi:hypothetical protein
LVTVLNLTVTQPELFLVAVVGFNFTILKQKTPSEKYIKIQFLPQREHSPHCYDKPITAVEGNAPFYCNSDETHK